MRKELPELRISLLYSGKKSSRFRIKYQSPIFKYPFVIRLDIQEADIIEKAIVTPLVTKFPIVIFPLISHLSTNEILAEKICALITRGKGRDLFDVWFILKKGTPIDWPLTAEKLKEHGVHLNFNKELLISKVITYPQKRLNRDLSQFLPLSQRKILPIIKKELVESL